MNPIKDIDDVIQHWDIFTDNWKSLYAFLLYTDEDAALAAYVREHFYELDQLSGNFCFIFLIDQPSRAWRRQATDRDYWKQFQFRQRVWEGFLESRPYDKAKAYKIAEYLGVPPRQMPCVVFFKDISDQEVLIYSLSTADSAKEISTEFREVFSVLAKSVKRVDGEIRDMTKEGIEKKRQAMWDDLQSYIRKQKTKGLIARVLASPAVESVGDVLKKVVVSLLG
jgi:hypothetical protein